MIKGGIHAHTHRNKSLQNCASKESPKCTQITGSEPCAASGIVVQAEQVSIYQEEQCIALPKVP